MCIDNKTVTEPIKHTFYIFYWGTLVSILRPKFDLYELNKIESHMNMTRYFVNSKWMSVCRYVIAKLRFLVCTKGFLLFIKISGGFLFDLLITASSRNTSSRSDIILQRR